MKVKYDDGIINVHNYKDKDLYSRSSKFLDVKNNSHLYDFIDFDFCCFIPINNGNDFVINDVRGSFFNFFGIKDEEVIGRIYGDAFPIFKDAVYQVLREVYKTKEMKPIKIYFYQNHQLIHSFNGECFIEGDKIFLLIKDGKNKTNPNDNLVLGKQIFNLKDNIYYTKSFIKSGTGFYDAIENKFKWTDGFYDIIEQVPKNEDKQRNILLDLLYKEDFETIHNKFTGISHENPKNDLFFRIRTCKGNVKYLHICIEGIYKNDSLNKVSYFLMDHTERKLIEDDLNIFNNSLNIIQSASKIGILTITPKGYFWSQGIYDIIERKRRENDSNHDILMELIADDDKPLIEERINLYSPENCQINFEARIVTEKNNTKYLNCIVRAVFDENEKIISKIAFIQDITDKKTIEDENIQLNEILRLISPKSKLSLIIKNPEGKYAYDDEFYEIFEFKKSDNFNKTMLFENIADCGKFVNKLSEFENDQEKEFSEVFEYIVPNSENRKTISLYLKHYVINKKNYLIGYCQDISDSVKREQDLKKVIDEKTILFKEVHHRVKNNLQILSSFLNLEEKFHKNDPNKIIQDVKSYLESLSLIHKKAYSSNNPGYIGVKGFLEDINSNLSTLFTNKDVEFVTSVQDDVFISIDILTPISLIINELTLNSIKHAFPNDKKDKMIYNSLHIDDEGFCEFIYKDNGIGLPEDKNIDEMQNLGWTIIKVLSNQLDGTYSLIKTKGMEFKLKFPLKENTSWMAQ